MAQTRSDDDAQKTERAETLQPTTDRGKRTLSAGRDIGGVNILGNIINSIVEITSGLLPWQKAVLLATLVVGVVTLAGVAVLVWEKIKPIDTLILPDPDRFEVVIPPTRGLSITALALNTNDNQANLWIGTHSESQNALYRLDPKQRNKAVPQHVLDVKGQIIDIEVDCKGNVWLALNETGTLVYQPGTGRHDTLLNRVTTGDWLAKNTTQAIASRCTGDGKVEVWLGRIGVRTLDYQGDYPALDRINFRFDEDALFLESKALTDIRDILYVTKTETLWIANLDGQLLSVSLKGLLSPEKRRISDSTLWSLSKSYDDESVWAGTSEQLIWINDELQTNPLVQVDGTTLEFRAFIIASGNRWVWFGDRCPEPSDMCWSLGVYSYSHGSVHRIDIDRFSVSEIAVDPLSAVWIGTETGLVFYPEP